MTKWSIFKVEGQYQGLAVLAAGVGIGRVHISSVSAVLFTLTPPLSLFFSFLSSASSYCPFLCPPP